jgi:hypothetical protein
MKFFHQIKNYKYLKYCINYKKIKKNIKQREFNKAKELIIKEAHKVEYNFKWFKYIRVWFSREDLLEFSQINEIALIKIIKKYNKNTHENFKIDKLPIFIKSHFIMELKAFNIYFREDFDEIMCCPICLDIMREPKYLPCHHIFCKKCLFSMKQHNCPICRYKYNDIRFQGKLLKNWSLLFNYFYIYNYKTKEIKERIEFDSLNIILFSNKFHYI